MGGREGGPGGKGESYRNALHICMKLSMNSLNGKIGTEKWSLWEWKHVNKEHFRGEKEKIEHGRKINSLQRNESLVLPERIS